MLQRRARDAPPPFCLKLRKMPMSPGMLKYREQLTSECSNEKCHKVFCRRHYTAAGVEEIAGILSQYADIFYCSNIERLLEEGSAVYKHPVIDLYFYLDGLVYRQVDEAHAAPRSFKLRSPKAPPSNEPCRPPKRDFEIRSCQELLHAHCILINAPLTQVDLYLLIGVCHLLLQKFVRIKNFNVGLAIIRLFIVISRSASLDQSYYTLLSEAYAFIYERLADSISGICLASPHACEHAHCLFQLNFAESDFIGSVEVVANALNASIITSIKDSSKIKSLLEIFKMLYEINERVALLNYDRFYLKNFSSRMNLKAEFKLLRTSGETALSYGFILPVHIKAEILKMANGDMMKSSLQDAFFRSLFEGVTQPYLFITIHRETVYADTIEIIRALHADELKKQLKIKFIDEEGIDSGGIRKEYFQLLGHEITYDKELFTHKNDRLWLRRGASKERLCLVGKIIGMALYNDVVLNIPLPFIIFKKILRIPLTFDDLAEIEPEHHSSIFNLGRCTAKEFLGLELFFTVDYVDNGVHRIDEIIPNGSGVQVTKDNYHAFREAYANFHTVELIQDEFSAFLDGFSAIIRHKTILSLHPKELEKIIIGLDEIDFEAIRATTIYNGYSKDARIIKDFWSIFESYSLAYKKRLLQFITGNDRLPAAGAKALKLIIVRNGCDTERLPSSQTCFNTLLLPEYASRDKLAKKLDKAIKLTAGFFLI